MMLLRRLLSASSKPATTASINTKAAAAASNSAAVKEGKVQVLIKLGKEIIPGDTPLKKGLFSTTLTAISAYLVTSGLYVPGEDTLTLTSFLLLSRLLYLKAGKPLSDYLEGEIAAEEKRWNAARTGEKKKYAEQLRHLESFRDYPQVVQTIYDMQAANLVLEDAVMRAKHRAQFHSEIAQKAQELVRKEQQRLAEEAREKRARLLMDLEGLLGDRSVQQRIVEKFILDMKTQPVVKLPALH